MKGNNNFINIGLLHNWIDRVFPKLLITAIILYIYKKAFWPLTYLLIASAILLGLLFIIRCRWSFNFRIYLKMFKIPLSVLVVILFTAVLNNDLDNYTLLKDILLLAILFSFSYLIFWTNYTLNIKIPTRYAVRLFVYIKIGRAHV